MLRDSWNAALESEGQAVLVSGEAGIGKSRLVAEFCDLVSSETHTRLRYQCSPQHTDAPFYPIATQLRRAAKINVGDTADQQACKLEDLLREAVPNVDSMASLFAELIGIRGTERLAPANYSPERFKELIFQATATQLEGLSAKQPILVIFEDLHWADPLTNELLAVMVAKSKLLPVMVLATTRPEHQPSWLELGQATHLNLNRIRRRGAIEIAKSAAGVSLPSEILDEILEKADGNPLFIEEITRSLVEVGLADRSNQARPISLSSVIPATLHDSLVGRLDRLATEKDIAHLASVIGRSFQLNMLTYATGRPVELIRNALSILVDAGLVYRLPGAASESYEFKHALIRDAAYDSLTRSSRANYHRLIAECMEEHFPHIVETDPALVGQHFIAADAPSRSLKYLLNAGKIAHLRTALEDAARHFRTGIEILHNSPPHDERDETELLFQAALGPTLTSLEGYAADSTSQAYERAYDLSRITRDHKLKEQIMSGLCTVLLNRANLDRAETVLSERIELGHKFNDDGVLCASYRLKCTLNGIRGNFSGAEPFARLSVEHFDQISGNSTDYQLPHQVGVGAHANMAVPLMHLGKVRESQIHTEKAVALARASDHPNTLGYALWWAALNSFLRRDRTEFVQLTTELGDIASKYGMRQWHLASQCFKAWGTSGDFAEVDYALTSALTAGEELERQKVYFFLGLVSSLRVQALLECGRATEALQQAEANLLLSRQRGLVWFNAELLRLRGEAELLTGNASGIEAAIKSFDAAYSLALEQGSKLFELRSAVNLANATSDRNRQVEIVDHVSTLISAIDADETEWDIQRARACLVAEA